jgi:HPt (histidine-containing phosphotransfer) domain-containing protein
MSVREERVNGEAPSESAHVVVSPEMREATTTVIRIGGVSLLEKVTHLFSTTAHERLAELGLALERGDRQRLSRLAHAMKGSAAQVGAEGVRRPAHALEAEAASALPDRLASLLEEISRELDSARAQLAEVRRAPPGIEGDAL